MVVYQLQGNQRKDVYRVRLDKFSRTDKALFWQNFWLEANRPQEILIASLSRSMRAACHKAIRQMITNHVGIVKGRLAMNFLTGCNRDLWTEIKRIRGHGRCTTSVVDNVVIGLSYRRCCWPVCFFLMIIVPFRIFLSRRRVVYSWCCQ